MKFIVPFFLAAVLSVVGCGGSVEGGFKPASPEEVRAAAKAPEPGVRVFESEISRDEFRARCSAPGAARAVRLVRVFGRESDQSAARPEYRIFGITLGSVYEALGLRNNDILLAVNGYSISAPQNFPAFIEALQKEPGGEFEVRRAGEALLLKIRFVG